MNKKTWSPWLISLRCFLQSLHPITHKATTHLPASITCLLWQLLPSPSHDPGTSFPFTTVSSFVTCQLIRPCRHITSTHRLKTIIVLKQKRYQMLTASYPKEFYGSFGAIPTEEHLRVSKLRDFINSSIFPLRPGFFSFFPLSVQQISVEQNHCLCHMQHFPANRTIWKLVCPQSSVSAHKQRRPMNFRTCKASHFYELHLHALISLGSYLCSFQYFIGHRRPQILFVQSRRRHSLR